MLPAATVTAMITALRKLLFAAVALLVGPLAVGAADVAEVEYEALKKLYDTQSLAGAERGSDAYFDWVLERTRRLHDDGLDFIATHAAHPRRCSTV